MKQKKNQEKTVYAEGSIAVFALIIMFILSVATIGIITTATVERRTSISTGNSTSAFQVAESGMEKTLQAFKDNFDEQLSDIGCSGGSIVSGTNTVTNTVKFRKRGAAASVYASCSDNISDIGVIKSIGTTKQETRAIEEVVFLAATKLLLHLDSSNFADASFYYYRNSITANSDATSVNNPAKISVGSASFDGTGDYLSVNNSSDWNFGTGDFTIDFWEKSSSLTRQHAFSFGKINDKNLDFDFNDSGYGIWVYWNSGGTSYIRNGAAGDYTNGSWHHIALVRKTGVITLYVDGQSKGNNNYTGTIDLSGAGFPHYIGASGSGSLFWNGYIDELRISKGVARWTSNFSPSTQKYIAD